jgi:RNA polymerase sigma factor (sigma-70 family)
MALKPSHQGWWLALYKFYPQLVALARAHGSGSDAEDVASTVLIRVWEKPPARIDACWPYLARSVVNEVSDRRRRLLRERTLRQRMFVRSDVPSDEERVTDSIEARRLMATLAEMNPGPTLAMIRLRIQGDTWSDIGATFGMSPSTVQARVRRALRSARPLLWSSGGESA